MLKTFFALAIILSGCASAVDVSLRGGDSLHHADIHYIYDFQKNAYTGHGGAICSACNTAVEDYVHSREGPVFCLECWDHWLFEAWEITDA